MYILDIDIMQGNNFKQNYGNRFNEIKIKNQENSFVVLSLKTEESNLDFTKI